MLVAKGRVILRLRLDQALCSLIVTTPLLAFSVATGGSSGSLGRESAFSAASSDLGHDLKNRGYNCVWLVGGNEVVTSRHDAPGPAQ